jgi:hypothetical protein
MEQPQQQRAADQVRSKDHPRRANLLTEGETTEGSRDDGHDDDPRRVTDARSPSKQSRFEHLRFGKQFPIIDVDAEVIEPLGGILRSHR